MENGTKLAFKSLSGNGNGNGHANGNGHGNGNGNGHFPWKKFGKETVGLAIAEGASMMVSMGVIATADQIAPNLLKSASKVVGKIIEPYLLDPAEWFMKKACKLEECQPDYNQSREERAERMARFLLISSAAVGSSFVVKLGTRVGMNQMFSVGPAWKNTGNFFKDLWVNLKPRKHDWKVVGGDEGVHLGAFFLMNTFLAKHTDSAIRVLSKTLQTLGYSEEKSKELAAMFMVWEVPNMIGFSAGVGVIALDMKRNGNGNGNGNGHIHVP